VSDINALLGVTVAAVAAHTEVNAVTEIPQVTLSINTLERRPRCCCHMELVSRLTGGAL
jgi:hypothetical protein